MSWIFQRISPRLSRGAACLLLLLGGGIEVQAAVSMEILSDGAAGDMLFVSGASPGGQVAFLGVGREERQGVAVVVQGCDLIIAGPDGVASWHLGRQIPDLSRWLAIDLASGVIVRLDLPVTLDLAATPAFPPVVLTDSGTAFRLPEPGSANVLVARPGSGAWCASLSDGGPRDSDLAEDGAAEVVVENLVAVANTSGTLEELTAGDWLAIGDSDALVLSIIQITSHHLVQNLVQP